MSSSKRPHTKSRLGCDQCKKRRIRCDYNAPECANCGKKGLVCGYRAWESAVDRLLDRLRPPPPAPRDAGPIPTAPHLPSPSLPTATTAISFSLHDLGLLHDWTLSAAGTIVRRDDPTFHKIWQRDVPKLGLEHPFLMHAILSFAAAYRVHHPDAAFPSHDKADEAARAHYDLALVEMRGTVSSLVPELADPLLCFSILISFVTLFLGTRDTLDPINDTLHLFQTIRITTGILQNDVIRAHLATSRIGALIQHGGAAAARNGYPDGVCESLDSLLVCRSGRNASSTGAEDYERLLATVAAKLKHMFSLTTAHPDSWDHLLSWPISLFSELPDFMCAIEQREPRALCVLAHWCVPLCNAPPKWFVKDWPSLLLARIHEVLAGTQWERGLIWASGNVAT